MFLNSRLFEGVENTPWTESYWPHLATLDDNFINDNIISGTELTLSPTLKDNQLNLFPNAAIPDDEQYQYDAQLNGSQTCKNNGLRATAEYLCSYPGVSWNTRMQSWLVYYEAINGRKSKTFNPKRYTSKSLDPDHPSFQMMRDLSPMEIAMHHACAFAAEVRYRAKVFKKFGYKVARPNRQNSVNSPTALVCRNSLDQETRADATGKKRARKRVRQSRSSNQKSKSNGNTESMSFMFQTDSYYMPQQQILSPHHVYHNQSIYSSPESSGHPSGFHAIADCDLGGASHSETTSYMDHDITMECSQPVHGQSMGGPAYESEPTAIYASACASHERSAANPFATPFTNSPVPQAYSTPPRMDYANNTVTTTPPSVSESALNLSSVVSTPVSKSPFRASLWRYPVMSHQADVQSHHQSVAQNNQLWNSIENCNAETTANNEQREYSAEPPSYPPNPFKAHAKFAAAKMPVNSVFKLY